MCELLDQAISLLIPRLLVDPAKYMHDKLLARTVIPGESARKTFADAAGALTRFWGLPPGQAGKRNTSCSDAESQWSAGKAMHTHKSSLPLARRQVCVGALTSGARTKHLL